MPLSTPVPQPFLRWAGSKRRLLHRLQAYWSDECERYVEPFMGSACLFFHLKPKLAVLGDINGHLITTFAAVRDHPRAVANAIKRIPLGKESYYSLRSTSPDSLRPIDQAARFIFLNRYCFNGLYRTNGKGHFNVPYASSRTGPLPSGAELALAAKALKVATLYSTDFGSILNQIKAGDFVYLDPPYAVSNRRLFRQYDPHSFGLHDLDRLARHLEEIDERGAYFLVSYAICSEVLSRLRRWNITRVQTQRNISGFSGSRRRAVELLISNLKPH